MLRRVSKQQLADRQISRIGKVGRHIGTVQATDADAAIRRAIEKFEIAPEHQDRIAARQIVVRRSGAGRRVIEGARLTRFFLRNVPQQYRDCSAALTLRRPTALRLSAFKNVERCDERTGHEEAQH